MNPVQKFLWFLVLLAAVATATAGVHIVTRDDPPPPVSAALDEAVPDPLKGRVWIGHLVESNCPACERLKSEAKSLETADVAVATINPDGSDSDAELAAHFYAAAGRRPERDRPEDVVLRMMGDLGPWSLTAEDGKPMGSAELAGHVWIADFMFTNCAGPCPMMNEAMKTLTGRLPAHPKLRFISFSVDPENDTPDVLREFAKTLDAPPSWRFLTGLGVYNLSWERFKLMARPTPELGKGNAVGHSTRFTLVDAQGRMRGWYTYDYDEPEKIPPMMERLVRDTRTLLENPDQVKDHVHDPRLFLVDRQGRLRGVYTDAAMVARQARSLALAPETLMSVRSLPMLNATLNGASFVFLMVGLILILNRSILAHKVFMTLALITSLLFLASYLAYHFQVGSVQYAGEGWMRPAYFSVLLSHTVLAAGVAPMALITVLRAWSARYDRHVAIARWTLPVWMYVSLTGILVYLMLYRL